MYNIRPEFCRVYSNFVQNVRHFFRKQGFLEVETPFLMQSGNVEAHIDSFQVFRGNVHKSPQNTQGGRLQNFAGYLITSPEYKMKALLSYLRCDMYQIAHCFRAGEIGDFHLEEFLMIEWYKVNADEFMLMDQCEEFLRFLSKGSYSCQTIEEGTPFLRSSLQEVLKKYAGCSWEREDLEQVLSEKKLPGRNNAKQMSYSDLFFTVFLNLAEPHLGKNGPEFLYHYPPELSAFSQIERGHARRFELYWNGIELANAYYELRKKEEYIQRFAEENVLRHDMQKKTMQMDNDFADSLTKNQGLPECSGIALGLDRLFLLLIGEKNLRTFHKN